MQIHLKTAFLLGASSLQILAAIPVAPAADLAVFPAERAIVRVVYHVHLRAVRDYDGTPIVLRQRGDGTIDAYPAPRAAPTYYLNGQPVWPGYAPRY